MNETKKKGDREKEREKDLKSEKCRVAIRKKKRNKWKFINNRGERKNKRGF